MQFTAARTFFTWSRSSSAPAKFHYISTVHLWTITVPAFLCLVLLNCDHVVCTSSSSSGNTSTLDPESVKTTLQGTLLGCCNCSTQEDKDELLKRITFCHTIALDLRRELQRFTCEKLINLIKLDNRTRKVFNNFKAIMARVDCSSKYSVKWNCSDCLDAYEDWICETYFTEALPNLRPSNQFLSDMCYKVIQRCPYFLPATDNQYSGQPVFDCRIEGNDT